uniref:Uncharacterized protein n=1 Tax=Chromera velia CCMP2878 TaxID=1169474 RepID=A0A0G4GHG6_9ALVE|eukprot:Cvel_651.t1-p1 / transcript=Cvel_651.t1 / gene=Cvel_651 / organism=Chromera_velia_CCMP2878 / gene_product=hypothetical protein / transcript_product=hypothetical protein / location=Cvel_scaffold20:30755-33624(+) / protein_length=213 / sequence_SO=supercontig / SO=protein_coding / is_pseudo=false
MYGFVTCLCGCGLWAMALFTGHGLPWAYGLNRPGSEAALQNTLTATPFSVKYTLTTFTIPGMAKELTSVSVSQTWSNIASMICAVNLPGEDNSNSCTYATEIVYVNYAIVGVAGFSCLMALLAVGGLCLVCGDGTKAKVSAAFLAISSLLSFSGPAAYLWKLDEMNQVIASFAGLEGKSFGNDALLKPFVGALLATFAGVAFLLSAMGGWVGL